MRLLGKTAVVLGVAGAMALGAMTPSEARFRPWLGAGIGLAAGALIAGAAANANRGYYGPGYGYYDAEAYPGDANARARGYGYEPAYPTYYYGSGYDGYNSNTTSRMRERQLKGTDY